MSATSRTGVGTPRYFFFVISRFATTSSQTNTSRFSTTQETYSLSVDEEKQALVLRTKNKKYFKVFRVATLARAGLALQQSRAKMSHDGCSTLTISYAKPESVIDQERKARASARDSSSQEQHGSGAVRRSQFGKNSGGGGEAPPECKQS